MELSRIQLERPGSSNFTVDNVKVIFLRESDKKVTKQDTTVLLAQSFQIWCLIQLFGEKRRKHC